MTRKPELLSVAEAAELAGCSDTTIRNKLRAGELEGEKIGRLVWMVRRSSVEDLAPTLCNRTIRNRAAVVGAEESRPRRRRSR